MKKVLSIFALLIFLAFIASGLYVFELPPFQEGGPFFGAAPEKSQQVKTQEQKLPEFLSEKKISRNKTYDERMDRGKLLEENNYISLAILEYQEASKLEPNSIEPLIKIGRIHLRSNEFTQARQIFEDTLKINPESTEVMIYLGRSFLGERKIKEATEVFSKITTENQTAKYYQGMIAAFQGEYDKSKQLLNEAVKIGGSEDITKKTENFLNAYNEFDFNQGGSKAHLKTLLARSFTQTGEYQMAIPLLFEVIKEKKDYRDAWILLGYSYLNIEKYQDALESFEEAKKLDPQKPETLFFLGLTYYALNDLKKAVASLELAKKNGFEPKIQVDQKLAEMYLQLKEYEKAAKNYENALAANSSDVNLYIRPIWIYLERLDKPQKALTLAQTTIQKHPKEAMSYNLLAWAEIGNNMLDEAEKNLGTALSINPAMDAVYLNYGLLYEKRGKFDEAEAYYKKAHAMGHGNSISVSAAERYNSLLGKIKNIPFSTSSIKTDLLTQ